MHRRIPLQAHDKTALVLHAGDNQRGSASSTASRITWCTRSSTPWSDGLAVVIGQVALTSAPACLLLTSVILGLGVLGPVLLPASKGRRYALRSLVRPFRRLQWKLTFSYTWITLTTLVLLLLTVSVVDTELAAAKFSYLAVDDLQIQAAQVKPYLSAASPDRAGIARWLQQVGTQTSPVIRTQMPLATYSVTMDGLISSMEVVDQQGVVLASRGPGAVSAGTSLAPHLPESATAVLRAALSDQTNAGQLVVSLPHDTILAAYPLVGPAGQIEGALVAQFTEPSQDVLLFAALEGGVGLALPLAILAALIGTLFGFLTARGFSHRFQNLSSTVEQWGQGNFTLRAMDASGDELGHLTRRLNYLAEQFQGLLASQQQLATLEERQRLARDLHDSVKQQVFAISMLVNSTKRLLSLDLGRAQTCLEETDTYVQHVQQELTTLVLALRPAALTEHGLVAAVSDLAAHWSQQSGIASQVKVECALDPSLKVEEALFRIAQEALANSARHSQASQVELTLTSEQGRCTLTVDDNGQGFDSVAVQGKGIGLRSMQERIHAVGGTLDVTSALGKGTRVTASCPAYGLGEVGAEERRDGANFDPHSR
jgi:signal transduction histidine kinase